MRTLSVLVDDARAGVFAMRAIRYCGAWPAPRSCPCFISYGDPPDDQAFDFIHVEPLFSRSSANDWTIRAHRHRNLFQIFLIAQGGGEMIYEATKLAIEAPAIILMPPTVAHGFHWRTGSDGWVVSFTEDVADALGERSGPRSGG